MQTNARSIEVVSCDGESHVYNEVEDHVEPGRPHPRSWDEVSTDERIVVPVLTPINRQLERVVLTIACLLLVTFALVTAYEVMTRNFFLLSNRWADETARLAFLWSVFLGAALGFRRNDHLMIDVFRFKAGGRIELIHVIVLQMVTIAVVGYYAYLGVQLAQSGLSRQFLTLPFPLFVGWAAIPVMGVLGLLFLMELTARTILARARWRSVQAITFTKEVSR